MKMSSKFTCRFCKEQFDVPKGLYKHLQQAHNAGSSRDNRTCPICGVLCSKYEGYRDHLLYIHGQTDDGQKLTFKSLNEFLLWKTELEIKHNCKYVLQSAPKVLPTKEKKYFYQCDRSDSKSKDKRDKKSVSVVMKTCSSVISVVEGTGLFKVEYWDSHSGHSDASTVPLTQNELEAAISSVEMVNAIADSDDSFDRSASFTMPENANSSISVVEKPSILTKTNSSSSINNFNNSSVANTIQRSKSTQPPGKMSVTKKKSTNTSILYSLASVACGKGIIKKPSNKLKENKNSETQSILKKGLLMNSKSMSEASDKNSESKSLKGDDAPIPPSSVCAVTSSTTEPTVTPTLSTVAVTTKATSSGPLAIAPKISTVTSNTINSLFTTNSAFPNQLVIVNPMNLDQSTLSNINSGQNVLAGQNILFSLGPIGQNVLPNSTTPQTMNQISALTDKSSASNGNIALNKTDSAVTADSSNALTATSVNLLAVSQSASNSATSTKTSTAVSTSPLTLTTGINNAPVILSSLPVGSTFMSVNNNLIPIASPSGAFIPTSLPPNIVLTPVVPSTSLSKDSSVSKASVSSAGIALSTSQNHQTQLRFTAPSTMAITVSSIVKEPVYTSSAVKHMSSIVASSTAPVSSTSAQKSSKNAQNKFIPITVAGSVSPCANVNKTLSSKNSNAKKSPSVSKSVGSKSNSGSKTSSVSNNKLLASAIASKISSISNKSTFDTNLLSTVTTVPTPKRTPSARKRISRSFAKSKQSAVSVAQSTPTIANITSSAPVITTKVVNSHLTLSPISSTPNVTITPEQLNKPGTFLFESSGEIYMLEPMENDAVENFTPTKSVTSPEVSKIKIDRSVQTTETSNSASLKSKLQRKRASPPTDDSAVMLKVKCYQLEMKYLSSQTECKRLKVELTKERLKNAELTGENAKINLEEEQLTEPTRNKALEIMKDIEDKYSGSKNLHIYTMTKTSVLRSLYEDLEELCIENGELHRELENYRAHDKFYKNLKKRLFDEDF